MLLDNANLCNPTVLDRLNPLLEPGGVLFLNECGHVNGGPRVLAPHLNFRCAIQPALVAVSLRPFILMCGKRFVAFRCPQRA